ncbi:MAG: thiamine-phosphate kinase [Lysobacterales bacterium]
MAGEFDWIARVRERAALSSSVIRGIGDDAAIVRPAPDCDLVISTDTLVAGVHFPLDTAPADVGYKTAAVNLSDLAAMGADPLYATLALSIPSLDPGYVDPLMTALLGALKAHGACLIGGDTTRGPLVLTLTVVGSVPQDGALRRDRAQAGDAVYVSGTLGDAAAALHARGRWRDTSSGERRLARNRLEQRLARPTPRTELGRELRGLASACIDVSDGLCADLGHLCRESGLAAVIDPALLPCSRALLTLVEDPAELRRLQMAGDDYELCFSVAPEREPDLAALAARIHVPLTRIGTLGPGEGVHLLDDDGRLHAPPGAAYEHFL